MGSSWTPRTPLSPEERAAWQTTVDLLNSLPDTSETFDWEEDTLLDDVVAFKYANHRLPAARTHRGQNQAYTEAELARQLAVTRQARFGDQHRFHPALKRK
eukprot:5861440-Pyramimonas_sp.AAC.1